MITPDLPDPQRGKMLDPGPDYHCNQDADTKTTWNRIESRSEPVPDPDPIQIKGQEFKKITNEIFFFFIKILQFTYP
jgi:hypothetical protein